LLVGKNLHVIGTKVGSLYDTTKALEFAAQVYLFPRWREHHLTICEVFPIAKMPEAIKKLQSGKVAGRVVVDFNS
jgi:propanol-preferring alcohol dehydrogenase